MHFSLVECLPDHRTARSPEAANQRLPRCYLNVSFVAGRGCPARSLLHRNGEVCVPRDVNLVTHLHFFEDGWIDDASAVFPSVRSNETNRRSVLVDCTDGRGYCFVRRRVTPRLRRLPHIGALDVRSNWSLTWWF